MTITSKTESHAQADRFHERYIGRLYGRSGLRAGLAFPALERRNGDALAAELYKADCLLFGRITYCGMMKHWESLANDDLLSRADWGFFCRVADCRKVICSRTLAKAGWKNSTLLNGDLKKGLVKLKQAEGKNIIVYGSGQLVSLLMQEKLVEELQLWLHPVLLGKGKPLFKDWQNVSGMKLTRTKRFETGVVLLYYDLTAAGLPRP